MVFSSRVIEVVDITTDCRGGCEPPICSFVCKVNFSGAVHKQGNLFPCAATFPSDHMRCYKFINGNASSRCGYKVIDR